MKRSTKALVGSLLVSVFALAGCDLPVLEVEGDFSQSGAQSGAQSGTQSGDESDELSLTDEQVDRIVEQVQAVIDESDSSKSADGLEERLVDPALSMRTGQLVRASKTDTDLAPLIVGHAVHSVTVGSSFPRVLVVASDATTDAPSEVFFLTQKDAKSDYMLENWVRLVGGTPVRGLAVQTGSKVLRDDTTDLELSPKEVLSTYVNHLNSPDNDEYKVFEDNVFAPRYQEELKALSDAVEVAGSVTAEASEGDAPITTVRLETEQGLMAASFQYTHVYKKTVEGSTLELAGTPAAYLEDPVIESSATVKYQVNIFFLVPEAGSDEPVAVVGAERIIKSVTKE